MKTKINILGFFTALILATTTVIKINYLPGGAIAMVLSGAILSIYLPLFIINKFSEAGKPISLRLLIVSIAASLINLGITFKFQHWPGANIMLILGLSSFIAVFLPLVFADKMKKNEGNNSKMYVSGFIGLGLFSAGILFKIMHWPNAVAMLFTGLAFLFLGYFLPYMLNKNISKESKSNYLQSAFLGIIIGSMLITFYVRSFSKVQSAENTTSTAALENQTLVAENLVADKNN